MNIPLVLTIKESAARAGIPVAFVRRLVAESKVHSVRSGSRFYVNWASLEGYLHGEYQKDQIPVERIKG
jgi:excisionase family DNA binding protein